MWQWWQSAKDWECANCSLFRTFFQFQSYWPPSVQKLRSAEGEIDARHRRNGRVWTGIKTTTSSEPITCFCYQRCFDSNFLLVVPTSELLMSGRRPIVILYSCDLHCTSICLWCNSEVVHDICDLIGFRFENIWSALGAVVERSSVYLLRRNYATCNVNWWILLWSLQEIFSSV